MAIKIIKSIQFNNNELPFDGWESVYYQLASFSLSCLLLGKYSDNIHVYTDDFGKNILEKMPDLPIKKIYTYPKINELPPSLIKPFFSSIQRETFIYVENDVFINEPLLSEKINQNIFVLCSEDNKTKAYMASVDSGVLNDKSQVQNIHDYNTGIIGGSDNSFFLNYYESIVNNNNLNTKDFNANYIINSHLLGQFADNNNIKIYNYYESPTYIQYPFTLKSISETKPYFHIPNSLKKTVDVNFFIIETIKKLNSKIFESLALFHPDKVIEEINFYKYTQKTIELLYKIDSENTKINDTAIKQIILNNNDDAKKKILLDIYKYEKSKKRLYKKVSTQNSMTEVSFTKYDFDTKQEIILSQNCTLVDTQWDWKTQNSLTNFIPLKIMYNLREKPNIFRVLMYWDKEKQQIIEAKLDLFNSVLFEVMKKNKVVELIIKETISFFKTEDMDNTINQLLEDKIIKQLQFWGQHRVIKKYNFFYNN